MTPHSPVPAPEHYQPPRRSWLEIAIRSLISIAILSGSVVTLLAIGTGSPLPPKPTGDMTPPVQVQKVVHHEGGIDFAVDGVVIPFREIEIPTEVSGRIQFKSDNCRVGHTVTEGELLIRIDQEDYELKARQIGENVKEARAKLHELTVDIAARDRQIKLAQEDLTIKQREVARYEDIDDPGVYSKSELDTSKLKELQARDALQTEKDQLELLEASRNRLEAVIDLGLAQLDKAKLDLTRTEIHSPIDGIITREGPEQGGYVQLGGMVAVVQDSSQMEIRCSLPIRQMNWLWPSNPSAGKLPQTSNAYQLPETPATVSFDMGAATCLWQGKLAYFDGGQVDQQTRMVPCRIVVDKPKDVEIVGDAADAIQSASITLLAGMFVNVEIHANPGIDLLRLPEQAVQPGNHVWAVTLDKDQQTKRGHIHRERINVAHTSDDVVLAYTRDSGLQAGDLIVVSPLASPTENARVEIMESK